MENNSLRQFLVSLCSSSSWCYAVFWKLHEFEDQMLLAYEDGHVRSQCQSISDYYSEHEEHPLGFAIDNMSCHQYVVGEGLLGRVADGRNDMWFYSDDSKLSELMFNVENPEEWLFLVAAGIQTTLMAPVLPYGVLQLGSFDKVVENVAEVSDIKNRVNEIKCPTRPYDENALLCSSIWMPNWEYTDESSVNHCAVHPENQSESAEEIHTFELTDNELSVVNELMFPNEIQLEEFTTVSPLCSDVHHPYMDLSIELDTQNEFLVGDQPETIQNMQLISCPDGGYIDFEVSDDSLSEVWSYFFPEQSEHPNVVENDATLDHTNSQSPEGFFTVTNLQDSPGSPFSVLNCISSGCSSEENTHHNGGFHPAAMSPSCWFDERADQENLFEASIATLCQNSYQIVSDMCDNEQTSVTLLKELVPSLPVEESHKQTAVVKKDDIATAHSKITNLSEGQSTQANLWTSFSPYASFESAVVEDDQPMNCDLCPTHGTVQMTKPSKGKARSKSSVRQRPRDRQLIQDRLKELRKLVPNSGKCSIDVLLEQTMKHMLFLRSVTKQANKLRQFGDQELCADTSESDASRSCQTNMDHKLGNDIQCPIIVKDLEDNGQFLIQMICNRSEVFFEMIKVIHQLKLTIVQGVMENDSRTWARFVVEASEDFNRLDIFWPLMRILQQNGDWMKDQWCA